MEYSKLDHKKEKIKKGDLFINNKELYYVKDICEDKTSPYYGALTIVNMKKNYNLAIWISDNDLSLNMYEDLKSFFFKDYYFLRINF